MVQAEAVTKPLGAVVLRTAAVVGLVWLYAYVGGLHAYGLA